MSGVHHTSMLLQNGQKIISSLASKTMLPRHTRTQYERNVITPTFTHLSTLQKKNRDESLLRVGVPSFFRVTGSGEVGLGNTWSVSRPNSIWQVNGDPDPNLFAHLIQHHNYTSMATSPSIVNCLPELHSDCLQLGCQDILWHLLSMFERVPRFRGNLGRRHSCFSQVYLNYIDIIFALQSSRSPSPHLPWPWSPFSP